MALANSTVTTGTILDRIVADKREELSGRKAKESVEALKEKAKRFPVQVSFAGALTGPRLSLIAEIKKASPTKGMLDPNLEPLSRARAYATGGAAGISILTETRHFLGKLEYLESDSCWTRRVLTRRPTGPASEGLLV